MMDREFFRVLGKRMKMIRVLRDLSQKELSIKLKVNPSLVSMNEAGKRHPTLRYLNKFVGVFEIKMSELFLGLEDLDLKSLQEISYLKSLSTDKGNT